MAPKPRTFQPSSSGTEYHDTIFFHPSLFVLDIIDDIYSTFFFSWTWLDSTMMEFHEIRRSHAPTNCLSVR